VNFYFIEWIELHLYGTVLLYICSDVVVLNHAWFGDFDWVLFTSAPDARYVESLILSTHLYRDEEDIHTQGNRPPIEGPKFTCSSIAQRYQVVS